MFRSELDNGYFFTRIPEMDVRPIRPAPKRSIVTGSGTRPVEATETQPDIINTAITNFFIAYPNQM